jgi:pimeloyl-ACP methyl ester carboxylesterase
MMIHRREALRKLRPPPKGRAATMAQVSVKDVVVDGVRSLVRTSGQGRAREAVVFVHGNPGSSEDWLDLLAATGDFARAVAPDMPGYGKADRPRDFDYTIAGYARHLDGLLRELGVELAHLVLHDFGGPWGLAWAVEHKDRVASVTLFDTGAFPGYTWHKFARVWRTPGVGEVVQLLATRIGFRLALNADNPRPLPVAFLDRMFDDSDRGHKRAVLRLYRATSDVSGLSEQLGAAIGPLSLPALVIWGEGDAYVPARYAAIQKRYFDAQVHVLPRCGHWPMIDEPAKVRELVIPFLRKQMRA